VTSLAVTDLVVLCFSSATCFQILVSDLDRKFYVYLFFVYILFILVDFVLHSQLVDESLYQSVNHLSMNEIIKAV
jgi:hypothetical protein